METYKVAPVIRARPRKQQYLFKTYPRMEPMKIVETLNHAVLSDPKVLYLTLILMFTFRRQKMWYFWVEFIESDSVYPDDETSLFSEPHLNSKNGVIK
jgi:hypothetical protein